MRIARFVLPALISLVAPSLGCGGPSVEGLRGPVVDRHVHTGDPSDHPTPQPPADAPDFANRIDDQATWNALAARPRQAVFARTEVVKFLIDLENERTLYLTQSDRFPIHYYFARARLDTPDHRIESHAAFNVREYRSPDRRFVCGSIVHYIDANLWTFEMISGDDLPGDRVLAAFEQIRGAVYFGDKLKYRPLSDLHRRMIAQVADRLPVVELDDFFAQVQYQPLTIGVAYGHLRIVRGPLRAADVRQNEILVTADVPDDLPPSMALVTSAIQAPLAHVAVLSQNRGTPNMALRGAIDDPRFTALDGQLVRLEVGRQDFTLAPATMADAEQHFAAMRPAQPFTPAVNRTEQRLLDLCDLDATSMEFAGAKASQLAEVCHIGHGVRTPGGFVVPFRRYLDHLTRNNLDPGIQAMLADGAFTADRAVRDTRLAELRRVIERAPIDRALLREVYRRVRAFPPGRVIFRSSTNAEDLVGFNGAGLYSSIVVPPTRTLAEVEHALREVWASVWTLRGFEERELYRIVHTSVAMAVLVQPFVENSIANGVAITRNPFDSRRPGVFINVQVSGGSVTSAGDDVPEQHLVYTYPETPEPEVLSRSSLTNGAPILPEPDVLRLTAILQELHARLAPRYPAPANAVDVEFLVTRDHQIVIVQARPYTVDDGE